MQTTGDIFTHIYLQDDAKADGGMDPLVGALIFHLNCI